MREGTPSGGFGSLTVARNEHTGYMWVGEATASPLFVGFKSESTGGLVKIGHWTCSPEVSDTTGLG